MSRAPKKAKILRMQGNTFVVHTTVETKKFSELCAKYCAEYDRISKTWKFRSYDISVTTIADVLTLNGYTVEERKAPYGF